MSLTATSGFFPTTGAPTATAGTAAGKPAADGPLGLFASLLGLVTGEAIGTPARTTDANPLGDLSALLDSLASEPGSHEPAGDTDAIVGDLIDALDALQLSLDGGTPLDPALEQQITALLAGLAGALGVPQPIIQLAEATLPALGDIATGVVAKARDVASGPATEAADPPPPLADLAIRLTRLADALQETAPALAERLAAIGIGIENGDLDPATLAALVKAAEARPVPLPSPPPVVPPTPTPAAKPFADPALPLPDLLAGVDNQPADAEATTPDTAGRDARGDADARSDHRAAPAREPPARPPVTFAPETAPPPPTTPSATSPAGASAMPPTAATEARAAHAAYAAPVHQINVPQVAFEIVRQVQAGNSRFQIRLDPPELGRIDVKLDMDAGGNVKARMTVERAETLDLMQRDHRALERALAQAGLDTSKTSLEFSLRQNPSGHQDQRHAGYGDDRAPGWHGGADTDTAGPPAATPQTLAYRGTASAGGVNLVV